MTLDPTDYAPRPPTPAQIQTDQDWCDQLGCPFSDLQ